MKTSRRDFFKAIGKLAVIVPFVDLRRFLPCEEKNVDAQGALVELSFEDNELDLSDQSQAVLTSYTITSSDSNAIYVSVDPGKGNPSEFITALEHDGKVWTYIQSDWIEVS